MRLFISEYLTSGACRALDLQSSLLTEGDAMLAACVRSLQSHSEIECCTTRDSRLPALDCLIGESRMANSPEQEKIAFEELARVADRVLLIAPETEGILEQRIDFARQIVGVEKLWNCATDSVRTCADKLLTAKLCEELGIPTIPTVIFSPENVDDEMCSSGVIKPRLGAGCEQTFRFRDIDELRHWQRSINHFEATEWIFQPWKEGVPLSNAFLAGEGRLSVLPLGEQRIAGEGILHYAGGTIPWKHPDAVYANRISAEHVRKLGEALPSLAGYAGIDWIWDSERDELCLMEVNPRMTTSVVGYESLAPGFLGHWFATNDVSLDFENGRQVSFTPAGRVR